MASATPRRSAKGVVSWRVQFRVDGVTKQETFTDQKSAEEFGRLVDRVGGTAARQVLTARHTADADTPTLRNSTHAYLDEVTPSHRHRARHALRPLVSPNQILYSQIIANNADRVADINVHWVVITDDLVVEAEARASAVGAWPRINVTCHPVSSVQSLEMDVKTGPDDSITIRFDHRSHLTLPLETTDLSARYDLAPIIEVVRAALRRC